MCTALCDHSLANDQLYRSGRRPALLARRQYRSAKMRAARLIASNRGRSGLEVRQLSPAVGLRPRLVVRSTLNQFYSRRTNRRTGKRRPKLSCAAGLLILRVGGGAWRPFPGNRASGRPVARSVGSSALHYSGRRASVTAPGRCPGGAPYEHVNHTANSLTACSLLK